MSDVTCLHIWFDNDKMTFSHDMTHKQHELFDCPLDTLRELLLADLTAARVSNWGAMKLIMSCHAPAIVNKRFCIVQHAKKWSVASDLLSLSESVKLKPICSGNDKEGFMPLEDVLACASCLMETHVYLNAYAWTRACNNDMYIDNALHVGTPQTWCAVHCDQGHDSALVQSM